MYSKETTNYKLPQWEPDDHPDFLTDMNEAYVKIDAAINAAEVGGAKNAEKLSEVDAKVELIESEQGDQQADIDANKAAVQSLNEKTDTVQEAIHGVSAKVDEVDNKLLEETSARIAADDELGGRVSELENSVGANPMLSATPTLWSAYSRLDGRTTNNSTQLENLTAEVMEVKTSIGDEKNPEPNTLWGAVQGVSATAMSTDTRLQRVSNQVAELGTSIGDKPESISEDTVWDAVLANRVNINNSSAVCTLKILTVNGNPSVSSTTINIATRDAPYTDLTRKFLLFGTFRVGASTSASAATADLVIAVNITSTHVERYFPVPTTVSTSGVATVTFDAENYYGSLRIQLNVTGCVFKLSNGPVMIFEVVE